MEAVRLEVHLSNYDAEADQVWDILSEVADEVALRLSRLDLDVKVVVSDTMGTSEDH